MCPHGNAIELSICGNDAATCQIILITCYCYYYHHYDDDMMMMIIIIIIAAAAADYINRMIRYYQSR